MPIPGSILENRYRIVRELKRGGQGAVHEARDLRLESKVAVKEAFAADPEYLEAFEREAKFLAGLHHPVLPRVIDHFPMDGRHYLVMQFIDGNDLSGMLEIRREGFPVGQVLRWGDQLLGALEYLHGRKIIHRDIKPANLKLTETGDVILLDFGLAKGRLTEWSRLKGGSVKGYTPGYAPLEQIHGTGTDERSDLYALGATLHHLLTGAIPTDCLMRAMKVLAGGADPLRPVHEINPRISERVGRVVTESLALDAEQRPGSAAEMRLRLREATESRELSPTFKSRIGGIEFVLIPKGKFLMGGNRYDSEKPIHEVTISHPFYLGKYQVTQGQWKAVMGRHPHPDGPGFPGEANPVERVSWEDVQEFLKKLNLNDEGNTYRLPSEAEWEYGCRAGTTGDYAGDLDEMAWYSANAGGKTHPVGQKKPNAWGLHDMHGNVWEWCADVWHADYTGAPTDGSAWTQGGDQGRRVLRGGSWYVNSDYCRSAVRGSVTPDYRYSNSGFRVMIAPRTQG